MAEELKLKAGPFKTVDISGMGGGYEEMCQRMLWRGVAHLAEAQPPIAMWKQAKSFENIYGVLITEGEDLKALEHSIIRDGDDVTGAMHQAVMGHLFYIHHHGQAAWLQEVRKAHPEDSSLEWEGEL